MYVQVKLLNNYKQPLLYKVPDSWVTADLVGSLVKAPLRTGTVTALVTHHLAKLGKKPVFAIKELLSLEPFPDDAHYRAFIAQLSIYYQLEVLYFFERLSHFLIEKKPRKRRFPEVLTAAAPGNVTLTAEQQEVYDFVAPCIKTPAYTPTLLHGITGSGKTEVYKKLIEQAIACHKTALFLLPEVTLALQFEHKLRQQLSSTIALFSFHSATSTADKRLLWKKLLAHEPVLIIGVHLPILLPIANLGLIIIDEEHEVGYQEKKHPKINTKEAALLRAKTANIPILLGSATPAVSSLYNVKHKGWHFFALTKRFAGALPTLKIVLLTDKKQRRSFWISKQLQDAIADRLHKKEQTILFLNRRGHSFFVQCKACSFIFRCDNCSVSLTLHMSDMLSCHYCGFTQQQPTVCPGCSAAEFVKKGIGTQQVVSILEQLFPFARIGRADLDVSAKKKMWQQTMADFQEGKLDILVGTQTITKGYHFPRVTLVGILWADLNLHFPMFNASETTLQQLIQVAGRAGRERVGSQVIVQAMGDYPLFAYLNEIDYVQFYEQEIAVRAQTRYPPCGRLVEIELRHDDEAVLDTESMAYAQALRTSAGEGVTVLGPAKPPVHKIKHMYMRKIYIKCADMQRVIELYAAVQRKQFQSRIFFTPNPLS
ncbi:MAG TPA: primosomal protein N' [Candidatus Limnocylindria bacterium]|nr:primosomal protein N' [Candidatus Limnocylindria bacterium]